MTTFIVILVLAAVITATAIYLKKTKIYEDKDGNLIPDAIEEKVEEVKVRAKRITEEVKDVAAAAKEVVKQSKDVVSAAKGGGSRRGRKPSQNKNSNTKK
jgi:molybdopterin biosynthesis enzyme MoaB